MGAGKTTVGKALAKALGLPFYDLDWYIETRMRRTVKQIFDESGEEGFRRIEHNMLHEVAEFENVVVSCGGGTPCFYDNIDYMNAQAQVVYLKASPEVLHEHLKMGRAVRPCCSTRRRRRWRSSSWNSSHTANSSIRKRNTPSTWTCSTTSKR